MTISEILLVGVCMGGPMYAKEDKYDQLTLIHPRLFYSLVASYFFVDG